nr:MAG TPA: hypothetical protein [Caudoviricetes sp.]
MDFFRYFSSPPLNLWKTHNITQYSPTTAFIVSSPRRPQHVRSRHRHEVD